MNIIKKGFTLIELLVVISLIGILSTLLVANLNSSRERARDAQRKSDLRNIQTALRLYYNDNNSYPLNADIPWGLEWKSAEGAVYMNIVPNDPLSSTDPSIVYVYTRDLTNTDLYTLTACLENKSDDKGVQDSNCTSGYSYTVKP